MLHVRIALIAGIGLLAGSAAAQVAASDDMHVSKSALSGQKIRVWAATMIEPDCTAHGTMTTQILDPAHHGSTDISEEGFYPSYPAANPRSACNSHKVPGRQLFYTSEAGFKGVDTIVMQNATSEGSIRRVTFTIDVR